MIVIVGLRVGVSLALLRSGVEWLLNTTSAKDIILNAAGLGFVMDVDEIVFETLLTVPVKTLLRSIEFHASLRWRGRWCAGRVGGVWLPCFAWLSVAALLAYVVPELQGNVNTMEELDMYLCGGNSDFVRTTISTGVIIVKKTEAYNGDLVSTYETKSLEEAAWIHDLTNVSLSWFAPSDSWFSLSSVVDPRPRRRAPVHIALMMPDGTLYASFLKAELGLDSFDCRDVSHFCAASNSSSIRAACPVTCGCAHPQSSLYLNGAVFACPPACKEHEQYKVALEKISCSTSDVLDHPNWTDFVRNMAVYSEELGAIARANEGRPLGLRM